MTTITITGLQDLVVPAALVVAGTRFTVDGASKAVREVPGLPVPGQTAATFELTVPGDYSVTVQNFDSTGATLGDPVTATFKIDAPQPVTIQVVGSVTVA